MFKKPMISIDIGSSSIKIMELTGGHKKKLKNMGLEVVPEGCIVDGEIKNQELTRDIIANLLKRLNIRTKGRKAAISVSGSGILIKRALFQPNNDLDFSEQVYQEAEQLFQHNMEDLYFRYHGLGTIGTRNAVLLIGAKRGIIDQHCAVIRSLDLGVGVVDCDTLCIANMFDHNYPVADATVIIVNIGATSTQVILTHGGHFMFSREIYIGGNEYTAKIAQDMGVDLENAESLKVAAATGDQSISENVTQIITEVNESLVLEIQRTLNFYLQNEEFVEGTGRPQFVFISGGGCRSPGLDAAIAAHLQLPVQVINPFQRVDVQSSGFDLDFLLSQGSIFGVSVGLGLRQVGDSQ